MDFTSSAVRCNRIGMCRPIRSRIFCAWQSPTTNAQRKVQPHSFVWLFAIHLQKMVRMSSRRATRHQFAPIDRLISCCGLRSWVGVQWKTVIRTSTANMWACRSRGDIIIVNWQPVIDKLAQIRHCNVSAELYLSFRRRTHTRALARQIIDLLSLMNGEREKRLYYQRRQPEPVLRKCGEENCESIYSLYLQFAAQ